MLTGEPPFTGDSPVAVAYQHVREDPKCRRRERQPGHRRRSWTPSCSRRWPRTRQPLPDGRRDALRPGAGAQRAGPARARRDERRRAHRDDGPRPAHRRPPAGSTAAACRRRPYPPTTTTTPTRSHPGAPDGSSRSSSACWWCSASSASWATSCCPAPPRPPRWRCHPSSDRRSRTRPTRSSPPGLRVGNVTQQESSVDQVGKVLSANPAAGMQVPQRSNVDMVVGSGPAFVNVPALAGMSVADATALLKSQGLTLGTQTNKPTDRRHPGREDRQLDAGPGAAGEGRQRRRHRGRGAADDRRRPRRDRAGRGHGQADPARARASTSTRTTSTAAGTRTPCCPPTRRRARRCSRARRSPCRCRRATSRQPVARRHGADPQRGASRPSTARATPTSTCRGSPAAARLRASSPTRSPVAAATPTRARRSPCYVERGGIISDHGVGGGGN